MNEAQINQYITETFADVDVVYNMDASFFFFNPDPNNLDHMYPFATIVTNDLHDQFSDLNRPDVFRFNVGVSKQTFVALFPGQPDEEAASAKYDFTALDQLMPHPVYGEYHWVCVLNPSDATFKTQAEPLLAEAYQMAVTRRNRKEARESRAREE